MLKELALLMANANASLSKRQADHQDDENCPKKVCIAAGKDDHDLISSVLADFNGARVASILNDSRSTKTLFVHGKFEKNLKNDAVIILEKKPFDISLDALKTVFSAATKLKPDLQNDIYSTYIAQLPAQSNEVKATVIYPATAKHLEKYKSQKLVIVNETEDDYMKVTKPFIEKQFENNTFSLQWVYNILEHKKEFDRIIFEDPDPEVGFVLLPDMKWNVEDLESLYVIALPHKRGLRSLRDLTDEHIPLLQNIKKKAVNVIETKFGVKKSNLRMYLHYQPSYYHLHVHVNSVSFDMPGTGILRAHLLTDVEQNLKLCSNYYKHKTLSFTLKENDKLLQEFYRSSENE